MCEVRKSAKCCPSWRETSTFLERILSLFQIGFYIMYEIRTLFTWLYIILSKFSIINQNNVPLEVIVDVFERIA